jgi:hypothetical protein
LVKDKFIYIYIYLVIFVWLFFVNYTFKLSMYITHTVPGRYTLKPLSLVLYLEEEEDSCIQTDAANVSHFVNFINILNKEINVYYTCTYYQLWLKLLHSVRCVQVKNGIIVEVRVKFFPPGRYFLTWRFLFIFPLLTKRIDFLDSKRVSCVKEKTKVGLFNNAFTCDF